MDLLLTLEPGNIVSTLETGGLKIFLPLTGEIIDNLGSDDATIQRLNVGRTTRNYVWS